MWVWLTTPQAVEGWLLALLVGALILSVLVIVMLAVRIASLVQQEGYAEDEVEGLRWRWYQTPAGAVFHPWAYCRECGAALVSHELNESGRAAHWSESRVRTDFVCEDCRRLEGTVAGSLGEALVRIQHELERRAESPSGPDPVRVERDNAKQ